MAKSLAIGVARRVDRAILTATLAFSGGALVGLVALAIASRANRGTGASLIYGICLVLCSLCSYLYNMLETARRRRLLRYLDHAAIFLLIAGTYTPFAAGFHGPFGIALLDWVWGLAIAGIVLKLLLFGSYDRLFVVIYLAIGWLFVSALGQFLALITPPSLVFLTIGGVAYTVGAIIYARDIGHWTAAVWHGCVLTGSLTHFIAVILLLTASGI
ncbi:MAG TPA: hemolysin III family protein [Stellaceae bacterium]|jgi:hemolysin III|nr:hemolysin III family protein [Stellaceae bacterium]